MGQAENFQELMTNMVMAAILGILFIYLVLDLCYTLVAATYWSLRTVCQPLSFPFVFYQFFQRKEGDSMSFWVRQILECRKLGVNDESES